MDSEGYSSSITQGVTYTISDPSLGEMNGNTFTARETEQDILPA